jgi:hypothetical protein
MKRPDFIAHNETDFGDVLKTENYFSGINGLLLTERV